MQRAQPRTSPHDVSGHIRWNLNGRTGRTGDGQTSPRHAPSARAPAASPGPPRPVVVVSLLAGIGTARLAGGDLMNMLGRSGDFHASTLVGIAREMANRVADPWSRDSGPRGDRGPVRAVLAADIWDLFMRKREPGPGGAMQTVPSAWKRFLDSLPPNCLLRLVGGSPCNNLSRAGAHQGLDGARGAVVMAVLRDSPGRLGRRAMQA